MLSKNQIDKFILNEALKYLKEEDKEFSFEDSIKQAEDNLTNTKDKIKTITTKLQAKKQVQTAIKDPEEKKLADQDVKVTQSDLEDEKKQLKASEEQLKNLETQQKDFEKNKSKTSTVIPEALQINPIQKVQQTKKVVPVQQSSVQQKPALQKKKELIVRFDANTASPFTVKFTNRGFLIGDTRLSFELLDKAISKNFSITLENGFILTPIKMQKILKYKDRV
jgi:hypothetical protein